MAANHDRAQPQVRITLQRPARVRQRRQPREPAVVRAAGHFDISILHLRRRVDIYGHGMALIFGIASQMNGIALVGTGVTIGREPIGQSPNHVPMPPSYSTSRLIGLGKKLLHLCFVFTSRLATTRPEESRKSTIPPRLSEYSRPGNFVLPKSPDCAMILTSKSGCRQSNC